MLENDTAQEKTLETIEYWNSKAIIQNNFTEVYYVPLTVVFIIQMGGICPTCSLGVRKAFCIDKSHAAPFSQNGNRLLLVFLLEGVSCFSLISQYSRYNNLFSSKDSVHNNTSVLS